jgi:hypothetical protein
MLCEGQCCNLRRINGTLLTSAHCTIADKGLRISCLYPQSDKSERQLREHDAWRGLRSSVDEVFQLPTKVSVAEVVFTYSYEDVPLGFLGIRGLGSLQLLTPLLLTIQSVRIVR